MTWAVSIFAILLVAADAGRSVLRTPAAPLAVTREVGDILQSPPSVPEKRDIKADRSKAPQRRKLAPRLSVLFRALNRHIRSSGEIDMEAISKEGLLDGDVLAVVSVDDVEKEDDGSLVIHGATIVKSGYSYRHFITEKEKREIEAATQAVRDAIAKERSKQKNFRSERRNDSLPVSYAPGRS